MEGENWKKEWGLFKEMSGVIGSRNFRQCKIFHQRMHNEFKNIAAIIKWLTEKYAHFDRIVEEERWLVRN